MVEASPSRLEDNWKLAQRLEPLLKIEPLESTEMHHTVVEARHVSDYVIWLKFKDGSEGEVDLAAELCGPVFEPLKEISVIRNFIVADYGTISWPHGADIAPEFLYAKAHVTA